MEAHDDLFADFPALSKEAWRKKAEKDLRGKPLEDLRWHLEENIDIGPYLTAEDLESPPEPVLGYGQAPWELGETIQVHEEEAAAAALREGLDGGVEAPLLVFYQQPDPDALKALLDHPDLGKASLHFTERYSDKAPDRLLAMLRDLLPERGIDASEFAASVDFDPLMDWNDPPFDRLMDSLDLCREAMPRARALQINGLHFHAGSEHSSRELANIIAKASTYVHELRERGLEPARWLPHAQFNLAVSTSYFVEIAKLRAFRVLWANVLRGYGVTDAPPPLLVVHFARDSQSDDVHKNMIRAGTQAMSAVLGGANRLYIRSADFLENPNGTAFTRRMARNVQHLLRLESHLGRVGDPGAGSYYLEKLTDKLCEEAWAQFQAIEREGGY